MADKKKTSDIIKSVEKLLSGEYGLALFYPAYSSFDKKLGRISMFSEGTKENAAVFCHAALFYITAMLQAGKGNLAMKYLKQIMPNYQGDYDLYKTEPYAYAEYLVGPEHPYLYGEGAFTWITGTAGWSFMAVTEHMLGIKREFKGLKIDPCIPKTWKRFSVTRPFRGTTYEIEVKNPNGVEKGVKKIFVDGKSINGDIIFPTGRKKSKVSVVMRKRN